MNPELKFFSWIGKVSSGVVSVDTIVGGEWKNYICVNIVSTNNRPQTLLITGSAGFIGSNLCEAILNLGYRVRCLDDLSTGKQADVDLFVNHPNCGAMGGIKDLWTRI